ncbi:MAG: LysR family transcriptional regulator [Betaproteobacteria bacterium]
MRIDPRRLLDLLAVARHGSISAAADAIHVSQPGLSQSIAQLEHGLGVRVLERDRHGARLTEIGRVLVLHAQAMEALLDRAKEEMRLRSLGIEGPLSVGITPVSAATLVPRALGLLLRETPSMAVTVTEGLDDELVAMLRAREIDVVVSRLRPGIEEVVAEPLVTSDWALIMQPRHPLATADSVSLRELKDVQWVLPAGGSAFRRQMEIVFAQAGLDWPMRGISTNSILAIKAIVMSTDCVTIMSPALIEVECKVGRLHTVPLTDVAPLQPVGMMWRAGEELSPVAARFAKVLRFVAAESAHV